MRERPMRHMWKQRRGGDVRCIRRGCRARKRSYLYKPEDRSCRVKITESSK